jgi:hypothetical protein
LGGLNLVGELYDYMLGIVIVGVIFISAVVAVPAISYVNLQHIDEQQLRNTALNLFNAMLLGTGSPVDWGTCEPPFDENQVEAFGLSLSGDSSLYTVDIDKLQRLDNTSLGYISYPKARELLGINEGYGFRLDIFRPFNVNWDISLSGNQVWYSINVSRNLDKRPIQNAEVSVVVLCAALNPAKVDDPIVKVTGPHINYTNALGKYENVHTIDIPYGYSLSSANAIFKVTVGGISTMVAASSDQNLLNILKVNTFGDVVTLTFRGELAGKDNSGLRRVNSITSYNLDEELRDVWDGSSVANQEQMITYGSAYDYWMNEFPGLSSINPGLLIFCINVPIKGEGRRPVLITGPFSGVDPSRVLSFGSMGQPVDARVKLRRFIIDSMGMTYVAELLVWKE